jgi:hypothetical protein
MATPLTDQEILDAYRAALLGLATAQSYEILGRKVTKANLTEIKNTIREYEWRVHIARNPDDAYGISQITVW